MVTTGCGRSGPKNCPATQIGPVGSDRYGQFCVRKEYTAMFMNNNAGVDYEVDCDVNIYVAEATVNRTFVSYPGGAAAAVGAVSDNRTVGTEN